MFTLAIKELKASAAQSVKVKVGDDEFFLFQSKKANSTDTAYFLANFKKDRIARGAWGIVYACRKVAEGTTVEGMGKPGYIAKFECHSQRIKPSRASNS